MDKLAELKKRLSEDPANAPLHYSLGKAYLEMQNLEEAAASFRKAVALAPEEVRYHLRLGQIYAKMRKPAQARNEYEKALALDSRNLNAHMQLGFIYEFFWRDVPRALDHYRNYVDLGGKNPRVLKHYSCLLQEVESQKQVGSKKNRKAKKALPGIPRRFFAVIGQKKAALSRKLAEKKEPLLRYFYAAMAFTIVYSALDVFPITGYFLSFVLSLAIAVVTTLDVQFGVIATAILLFFPIAYYSTLAGYLYAAGAFLLLMMHRKQQPGLVLAILLVPVLLKLNLVFSVPLGAAIFLGARYGRIAGTLAALTALGCLLALNLHQVGPLCLNHSGVPILVAPADRLEQGAFLSFQWLKSPVSARMILSSGRLLRSVWPEIVAPPLAPVQIAAWGFAGYAAGRLYRKQSMPRLLAAFGVAAVIFLLQASILEALGAEFSSWAIFVNLFWSAAVLIPVVVLTSAPPAEKAAEPEREDWEEVDWDSIGGLEDTKREIQMVMRYQFGHSLTRFAQRFGLKGVKGILLYGPPGCGKTLIAKVLAREAGVAFSSVKGSDFRSKWFGESEQNLKSIFDHARSKSPAILFFDEIDHMLEKRGGEVGGDKPEAGILAQFLTEMDGVQPMGGILVMGASNEPDVIDPAALRPGRFDKLIYIPLPDAKGRAQIFQVHLNRKPVTPGIDLHRLAQLTERFSGADIAGVCLRVAEEAMETSLREGHTMAISMAAIEAQIKASKPSVSLKDLKKYEALQEKYSRRTRRSETGKPEKREKYGWQQIGGLDQVKRELIEAVETPLRKPHLYRKYGIKPPKGVLLYGPPGCGKTLLIKALSEHCGSHFLSVDAKKESFDGIRDWFIRARENRPCILFFDEIDSVAGSRDLGLGSQGPVTQLLVEMDGMEELKGVVVIAATNRPDQLDSALVRPGRFDRMVYIPPPDQQSREQILRIHFKGKPLSREVSLKELAQRTERYSGADLSAFCYEASMNLIRNAETRKPEITLSDIESALEKIKPSIVPEELAYFDEVRTKYSRG